MKIEFSTMLIQKPDGSLWFKEGGEEQAATNTDICKLTRNLQYNLVTIIGAYATDAPDMVRPLLGNEKFEDLFWQIDYREMPDNCDRVK